MQFQGLSIGIPKEIMAGERRVSGIPETVRKMAGGGAKIFVEKGAGEGSYFMDEQYRDAGAVLVDDMELDIPPEIAVGEGGYAKKLPDDWLKKEREALQGIVAKSDIIILSALIPGRLAPILITDDMVKSMSPGGVIVDISIDQGGNCEATRPGENITKYGVSIDGTKNIPGMVPTTSTWMFAHNIYNYLANLAKEGTIDLNLDDEIIASSLVTHQGKIVHAGALEAMNEASGGMEK
jgi:NAD(P) transhydrogenase subunit alpha